MEKGIEGGGREVVHRVPNYEMRELGPEDGEHVNNGMLMDVRTVLYTERP